MDKLTYLKALSDALEGKMSDGERDEVIRYYSEYFADAGEGREGEVVAELGSPEALARRLLAEGSYERRGEGGEARDAESTTNAKAKGMLILLFLLFFLFYFGACHHYGSKNTNIGMSIVDELDSKIENMDEDTSSGFWSLQDQCLEAFTSINIDVAVGSVTVTSGEDYTLSIDQRGMPEDYETRWEVKRSELKITSKGSSNNINGFAKIDITVPDDVSLNDIEVKTLLGNIFLSNISTSENISAVTYLGNMECYYVKPLGDIDLSTKMGDITFALSEPLDVEQEVELDTGTGNIEAQMGFKESLCGYELETKMGEVSVNGTSYDKKTEKNSEQFELKAETSMGDISVFFKEKQ